MFRGVRPERSDSLGVVTGHVRPERNPVDWLSLATRLEERRDELDAEALDRLAEAHLWTDRRTDSIAARTDAHRRWLADGDLAGAAMAAWHLFYEHWLVGETVIGRSWLELARDHVRDEGSGVAGWLGIADADVAMSERRPEDALARARSAVGIGEESGDDDLLAMALQASGRALILAGHPDRGVSDLDRAMIMVIGNRLRPLFTGWVYCNVIATCHGIADVRRANEWCKAALRWCDSLRNGALYPGLCRVYAAELAVLRGDWDEAAESARRACTSLTAFDERYAGAAHYTVGELARLRGDFPGAEASFDRAHRLGHLPQPGLALMRCAQDQVGPALASLRSALDAGPVAPLQRIRLLSALVEVAIVADDPTSVELGSRLASESMHASTSPVVQASARSIAAAVSAWKGEADVALGEAREAVDAFQLLRMPYEAARERERIAELCARMGDDLTAEMELAAALDGFDRLGASNDASRVRARLGDTDSPLGGAAGLSDRELEVVRLVARGLTNRQVAERLFLSPHTVSRHLSNIYAKLGVGSRSAATSWAHDHGLMRRSSP